MVLNVGECCFGGLKVMLGFFYLCLDVGEEMTMWTKID